MRERARESEGGNLTEQQMTAKRQFAAVTAAALVWQGQCALSMAKAQYL